MRTIYIISSLTNGGAEKMLTRLAIFQKKKLDYKILVINLGVESELSTYLKYNNINVVNLKINFLNFFFVFFKLSKIIKNFKPQIIKTWLYHADLIGGLAAKYSGNNNIIWGIRCSDIRMHASITLKSIIILNSWLSKYIPIKIISNSKKAINDHIKIGYSKEKFYYIPNGYKIEKLRKSKLNRKNKLTSKLRNNCINIGSVGRFHPMKDHENFLIMAVKLLVSKNRGNFNRDADFKFLLVGKDIDLNNDKFSKLFKKIVPSQYQNKFLILGEIKDIDRIYKLLDILIISSVSSEGFPNVAAEALLSGVPVVSTKVGDIEYIIKDKNLIVRPKNNNELVKAVIYLLKYKKYQNKKYLNSLKKNILNNYSLKNITYKFDKYFKVNFLKYNKNYFANPFVGYSPMSRNLLAPGDRRRFSGMAKLLKFRFNFFKDSLRLKYNIVFLTQNSDLTNLNFLEKTFVIFDITDAYLSISKKSIVGWLRGFAKYLVGQHKYLNFNYWKTIERMCRKADLVICSTDLQKKIISKFQKNVEIVLDYPDKNYFHQKFKRNYAIDKKSIKIVWEGLPQNVKTLKTIVNVIKKLSNKYHITIIIVTDVIFNKYLGRFFQIKTIDLLNKIFGKEINFQLVKWSTFNYQKNAINSDFAIIPIDLTDRLYSGKPSNKLLIFWRMGVPTIVSATEEYVKTMKKAKISDFCYTEKDWEKNIISFIENKELRRKNGILGKKFADLYFSKYAITKVWKKIFSRNNLL
ncbi:glycosyltransferase [Pelagibacteraceae bacterium]|nr:glycosyltransferase [Pelagibacteraceae bacterium]